MATHDYVLDNATGANFRSDLNNALAAIVSNNSSSSEPSTKYAYQWWADTNDGVLKIRNSANDGWVTLLQLDGTLTLEDGTNSAPALGFRDDLNTGIFSSAADTLDVTCGGTTRGSFSSSGLTVTGNVTATTFVGNIDAVDGDFDGTLEADAITVAGVALSTVIAGTTLTQAAQTNITSLGTLTGLTVNGTTEFTANVKFDGGTAGRDVTFLRSSNLLRFQDNTTFSLGDDDDFSAFHDGSKTRFINDTGNLELQSDNYIFRDKDNGDLMMKLLHDAAVELYYDNSKKAETTSLGLQLTNAHIFLNDSYYVSYGTGNDLLIYHDGSDSYISNVGTGELIIQPTTNETAAVFRTNGSVELFHDNSKKLETSSSGVTVTGTCTATAFSGDGSGLTGVGGAVGGNNGVDFNDSVKARFGTGNDLEIFHDGSNSFIKDIGTGDLVITTNTLHINNANNDENMIKAIMDNEVELYFNNVEKLNTKATGINVIGNVHAAPSGTTFATDNDTYVFQAAAPSQAYMSTYAANDGTNLFNHGFHFGIDTASANLIVRQSKPIYFYTNDSHRLTLDANGHLLPAATNSFDLGSTSKKWRNVFTNDLNLSNEGGANDVDSTWGSFKIQEGHHDLFLINNRTGKKFKFNLTEVS